MQEPHNDTHYKTCTTFTTIIFVIESSTKYRITVQTFNNAGNGQSATKDATTLAGKVFAGCLCDEIIRLSVVHI